MLEFPASIYDFADEDELTAYSLWTPEELSDLAEEIVNEPSDLSLDNDWTFRRQAL